MDSVQYRKKRPNNHFRRNKGKYFAGGICLLIGGVIGAYASKFKREDINVPEITKQVVEMPKSIFDSDLISRIGRNGHPGNVIYCNETRQVFRSHREATRELGINPRDLWAYLKGLKADARGYTFTKLGEAGSASALENISV